MKFLLLFFFIFLDCRYTKLLRLFFGNLPAMFAEYYLTDQYSKDEKIVKGITRQPQWAYKFLIRTIKIHA